MNSEELIQYKSVQNIAKQTIDYLKTQIKEGDSEIDIANMARIYMLNIGATSFWYHELPAIILVGNRTPLSVSGKEYKPTLLFLYTSTIPL